MNGAPSFRISNVEVKNTLKVFGWTMASALVALALSLLQVIDIPQQYVLYIPIINTLLYATKEFIANNQM